jgi:hypothetical protein
MNLHTYLVAVIAVACMSALPSAAQISAGCTGYAQSLTLSGDYPDGQAIRAQIGYGVGVAVAYRLLDDVEVTFEPSLDLRHGRSTETISTSASPSYDSTVATIRVRSMSIPLGVRIWSQAHTWVFTSGIAARIASSGMRTDGDGTEWSFTDALSQLEVGVYLGVGYRITIGNVRVLPELRYEQGISNVLRGAPVVGLPPAPILRTNGFSLRVACQYELGGGQ